MKGNGLEQFYTKEDVSVKCVEFVKNYIENQNIIIDRIIEPSAGTGSFLKALEKCNMTCKDIYAYDIEPKYKDIQQADYLSIRLSTSLYKTTLVLGNPPFGKNSCLAKKFIKKVCIEAHIIAFILPMSFKKDTFHSCFNEYFHLETFFDIDKNAFILEDKTYNVPCVFQIWVKKEYPRLKKEIFTPINWDFCSKEYANIAFQRVGSKAGTFKIEQINNLSIQSHYFLSIPSFMTNKIMNYSFEWQSASWTTGPKSISKNELTKSLNDFIEKI
jgi:predicted RNA methylase